VKSDADGAAAGDAGAMGRKLRDAHAGTHHITLHAIASAPLFVDDEDFRTRLEILANVCVDACRVNMLCLMDNHEHLLLTVADGVLPNVMRTMNRAYAGYFNSRHGHKGHVYDGPYHSERIASERHALTVVAYIALNPEGMRYTAETYPWSSYRSLVDGRTRFPFVDPAPVLAWFGGGDRAREDIATFVADSRARRPAA
jgi:putative transposase